MRMDIFNKLNEEQKIEVIRQFLGVYGVDEALDDGNLFECMNEFECALYTDGSIGSADDLNTLGDLLTWAIRSHASADNFEAFRRAVNSAREYMKTREFKPFEVKPEQQTFDDMEAVLQHDGIWFDDWGNMAFVDDGTSEEMLEIWC